jgi:hypothetical protein
VHVWKKLLIGTLYANYCNQSDIYQLCKDARYNMDQMHHHLIAPTNEWLQLEIGGLEEIFDQSYPSMILRNLSTISNIDY